MKPIEMPAQKLTADSIWNSFRSSGKKHLILTGSRGSGKSTLLKKLIPEPLPGIRTWAVPGKGVFLEENGTRLQAQIGAFRADPGEAANCMTPVNAGFLNLGIPALARCEDAEQPFVSIDEIGYLEVSCPAYCDAIERLLDKKQVIAVLRKQNLPFLNAIRDRDDVFVLDLDAPFGNGGCVVMASGLGKRFGGNKLMADFRGAPMVQRILSVTEALPHRVVVTRHADVVQYCENHSVPVVLHSLPYRSDTVRLGLEALKSVEWCMFCPADQPLLTADTVNALALCAANEPGMIWRTAFQDEPGAPIVFPRSLFPELLTLPQGKGGGFLAKKYPEQVRILPVRDKYELKDADTPADFSALTERQV